MAQNRSAAARAGFDAGIDRAVADGDAASAGELLAFACALFGQRSNGERRATARRRASIRPRP